MKNLIVDIGNSRVKYCNAENEELLDLKVTSHANAESSLRSFISSNPIDSAIISSTASKEFTDSIIELIEEHAHVVCASPELDLPFKMDYSTPKTLGLDRIANVCGAIHFHPDNTSLIIDIGTCITYDVLEKGEVYKGGAISPGMKMRFKAMNDYSARLPRLTDIDKIEFPGSDTNQSLRNGVYYGILGEINQFIIETQQSFGEVIVHLTGGDSSHFEKGLKCLIFANPKLTLWGLYELLKRNN